MSSRLRQLFNNTICPPRDPKKSFAGKTILMTGISDIGIEAAIKFARLGAAQIIIGTSELSTANSVKGVIEEESSCDDGVVSVLPLSIESFPSTETFVNNVRRLTPKVHAVILENSFNYNDSDDHARDGPHGAELCLQVNVISKGYLAILLLGLLLETSLDEESPTHLEFVGSPSEHCRGGTFERYQSVILTDSILSSMKQVVDFGYQFSFTKFAEMAMVLEMAKSVDPSKIIVTVACPGRCEEPEWKNSHSMFSRYEKLCKRLFARTSEQGSRSLVSGVLQGPIANGKLWGNDRFHS